MQRIVSAAKGRRRYNPRIANNKNKIVLAIILRWTIRANNAKAAAF
jgi:hypothetical protein